MSSVRDKAKLFESLNLITNAPDGRFSSSITSQCSSASSSRSTSGERSSQTSEYLASQNVSQHNYPVNVENDLADSSDEFYGVQLRRPVRTTSQKPSVPVKKSVPALPPKSKYIKSKHITRPLPPIPTNDESECKFPVKSDATHLSDSKSCSVDSCFAEEPLYQDYHEDLKRRTVFGLDTEAPETTNNTICSSLNETSNSTETDLAKSATSVHHSYWHEEDRVIKSGILQSLTKKEKSLQEAKFEIITSEASYYKSLKILTTHFQKSYEMVFKCSPNLGLTNEDIQVLFGNAENIKNMSKMFLDDLKKCWKEDFMLTNLPSTLLNHIMQNFWNYEEYVRIMPYQEEKLEQLRQNEELKKHLIHLEGKAACNKLPLISFISLPMQRITKFPLLLEAIVSRLEPNNDELPQYQSALTKIKQIVITCNSVVGQSKNELEMQKLSELLYYAKNVTKDRIQSSQRWIVKKGKMEQLIINDPKRISMYNWDMQSIHVILFNDLLLITKLNKRKQKYQIQDYCERNKIIISEIANVTLGITLPDIYQHLFRLTLLENHNKKEVEFILYCPSTNGESSFISYTKWMKVLKPAASGNPDEKIYEEWDCPQVVATKTYVANEHDQLSLEVGDIINVTKKINDGWCFGVRREDGKQGWFPRDFTNEVLNKHVVAKYLRERHKLMECAMKIQQNT